MKKIAFLAAAACAAIAMPAMAQTTGTINLTGSVAAKCTAAPGGATFGDSTAFGELALTDGTMRTNLASSFGTHAFTIICNTGTPTVSVDADALATTASATAGYDNSIDYTATVTVKRSGTTDAVFTNDTSAAATAAATLGAPLANAASNVSVTTSTYHTNTATDLLVASPTYTGVIKIVIAPS